ncbi:Protein of unknown function, partial [Gryllus bimaculatus]
NTGRRILSGEQTNSPEQARLRAQARPHAAVIDTCKVDPFRIHLKRASWYLRLQYAVAGSESAVTSRIVISDHKRLLDKYLEEMKQLLLEVAGRRAYPLTNNTSTTEAISGHHIDRRFWNYTSLELIAGFSSIQTPMGNLTLRNPILTNQRNAQENGVPGAQLTRSWSISVGGGRFVCQQRAAREDRQRAGRGGREGQSAEATAR